MSEKGHNMLRELDLNEMEMVSGGSWTDADTIDGSFDPISGSSTALSYGDPHLGMGVYGQIGGGSHGGTSESQSNENSTAEETPTCINTNPDPDGTNMSHTLELNRADGGGNDYQSGETGALAGNAVLDIMNALNGCWSED